MEKPQARLLEAARVGSMASLHQLLRDDPLILDRAAVNCFNDTPLHVAAMLGHVDMVKEIVSLKPEMANQLNSDGSSPLHLASAKGHVQVLNQLLRVDTRACLLRDRNRMLPLHVAAAKGRVEAVQLLLEARPEAVTENIGGGGGENILHMCVKRYQLEALRVMVKSGVCSKEFLNSKDGGGNTVLHLAVAEKQVETVTLLVSIGGVEVNALNEEGMTPLDVLIRSRRDARDSEIEKSLVRIAGTTSLAKQDDSSNNNNINGSSSNNNNNNKNNDFSWQSFMNKHAEWIEKKKEFLMVVASLIATMAFQVGVNPPGGVWQDDFPGSVDAQGRPVDDSHVAGESIYADKYIAAYTRFYAVGTVAFLSSLSIIVLLMSGLPMRQRRFMWILMVVTWIAITAIAYCYLLSIDAVAPSKHYDIIGGGLSYAVLAWGILMGLLYLAHTIRLIARFLKKTKNSWVRTWARRHAGRLSRQNP